MPLPSARHLPALKGRHLLTKHLDFVYSHFGLPASPSSYSYDTDSTTACDVALRAAASGTRWPGARTSAGWRRMCARGRKDTVSGVTKENAPAPASSLPPTPTEVQVHTTTQVQTRIQEWQSSHPSEPDYLPQSQPFPAQKHFNSLGASSALTPSPQIQTRLDYQRSVSAGSAALLARSAPLTQSQCVQLQLQEESLCQRTQYAHLPGASTPYATLTRAEMYTPPPVVGRSVPPRSPPHAFQVPAHAQQQQQRPVEFKRSASAMGVYHAHEHEDHPTCPSGDFKRSASAMGMLGNANTKGRGSGGGSSLSALVGSGIMLGAPASTLGRILTPTPLLVRSMARLWDGEEGEKKEKENGEAEGTVQGKKEKEGKEKKVKVKVKAKEEKKAKEEAKEKEKKSKRLPKSSGSSFEVSALGASPVQQRRQQDRPWVAEHAEPGSEQHGHEGEYGKQCLYCASSRFTSTTNINGLPSSLSSSQSSAAPNPNRLSADGSSAGCSSRVSSTRWAEEVVNCVRGRGWDSVQREEREHAKESKKAEQESQRTSEGRKRTPLSDVFPGLSRRSSAASGEATQDGHGYTHRTDCVAYMRIHLPLICRPCMPFQVLYIEPARTLSITYLGIV
ncbi:hypothetical protein B0H14DRAFT_3869500 [Mycena olivaceomarginata]|nr:hypothetical protein B0H14DRAFT_3869500 [Mycena olivaceomarginata]